MLQQHHKEELRKLEQQGLEKAEDMSKDIKRLQQQHQEELGKIEQQGLRKAEEAARELESIRRSAQSEAERLQRTAEADRADFKATISRLEVDLMRVSPQGLFTT
jgi:cell division septum initiation protein DivIVA